MALWFWHALTLESGGLVALVLVVAELLLSLESVELLSLWLESVGLVLSSVELAVVVALLLLLLLAELLASGLASPVVCGVVTHGGGLYPPR